MAEHTPEPWTAVNQDIRKGDIDADGLYLGIAWAESSQSPSFEEAVLNARRIVACVNACAGIPTEVLESMEPGQLHR